MGINNFYKREDIRIRNVSDTHNFKSENELVITIILDKEHDIR